MSSWVADSTQPGFLGPSPTETFDTLTWENFLQAVVAGISGLPGDLVRPRWQPNPPPTPDVTIDWAAAGITRSTASFTPYMQHYPDNLGFDRVRRQEQVIYRVSFYGPHAGDLVALFRDGLFIDQNGAIFRANAVGLVEAERIDHVPELFRQQWRDRYDLEVILNREVRRIYQVRSLVRAKATIFYQLPYSDEVIAEHIDTGDVTAGITTSVLSAGIGLLSAGPNKVLGCAYE